MNIDIFEQPDDLGHEENTYVCPKNKKPLTSKDASGF